MEKPLGQTTFDKIKIIDNVFSLEEIENINHYLQKPCWRFGQISCTTAKLAKQRKFWMMHLSEEKYFNTYLFEIVTDIIEKKCSLEQVYANGQTYGQDGYWHQDSNEPNAYTFLYYANPEWNIDWDGDTIFLDQKTKQTYHVTPKPNTAILFPANIIHRAESPSREFYDLRITVAFKFREITE